MKGTALLGTVIHDSLDLPAILSRFVGGIPESDREFKKVLPAIAKDPDRIASLRLALAEVRTAHAFFWRDARSLDQVEDGSVHLVITSPPYWKLKEYEKDTGQLALVEDFDEFNDELDKVWRECFRVLVPGGRVVVVVGDVCLSRRRHGKHSVVPLHAAIQERCRLIGFDNLAPIIWYKISNATLEVAGGPGYLGKPYEPNAVIKNDIEYILMQRKPGGYRSPTLAMRALSVISREEHQEWFQQIWTLSGVHVPSHPAPFPLKLAERLVRMFSFVGDLVLDPFSGTGTTNVAAALSGRSSIGCDINADYVAYAASRLEREARVRGLPATIQINGNEDSQNGVPTPH